MDTIGKHACAESAGQHEESYDDRHKQKSKFANLNSTTSFLDRMDPLKTAPKKFKLCSLTTPSILHSPLQVS